MTDKPVGSTSEPEVYLCSKQCVRRCEENLFIFSDIKLSQILELKITPDIVSVDMMCPTPDDKECTVEGLCLLCSPAAL